MTLQDAVVEAFDAWAEKLRNPTQRPAKASQPQPSVPTELAPVPAPRPPDWLKRTLRLDRTGCPEVELASDGVNHLWMFRDSDTPLNAVLGAVADGLPVTEIADVFEIEMLSLPKVLQFAAAAYESDALN